MRGLALPEPNRTSPNTLHPAGLAHSGAARLVPIADFGNGTWSASTRVHQRSLQQSNGLGRYDGEELLGDLRKLLQSRPGRRSGRYLGNPANVAPWTPDKIDSLLDGLHVARDRFYPNIEIRTLSRMILAEAGEESTGDMNLNVRAVDLNDWRSQGLMQVTPGSVLKDFKKFGKTIRGNGRSLVLDPRRVEEMDLADPATSVAMWAWYSRNTVVAGKSLDEWVNRDAWNLVNFGRVRRDLGNAQLTWRTGPRVDRHSAMWRDRDYLVDYRKRMLDYWTQSGFGTEAEFERNLAIEIIPRMTHVRTTDATDGD